MSWAPGPILVPTKRTKTIHMNIYYVAAIYQYEGEVPETSKVFKSYASAEAYKAELEAKGVGDWAEIREMELGD
jgi:hypothetical protein